MTKRELRRLIASILRMDEGTLKDEELDQSRLSGWDSLAHLKIIIALEKETQRKFTAKQISNMVSLEAIAREIGVQNT